MASVKGESDTIQGKLNLQKVILSFLNLHIQVAEDGLIPNFKHFLQSDKFSHNQKKRGCFVLLIPSFLDQGKEGQMLHPTIKKCKGTNTRPGYLNDLTTDRRMIRGKSRLHPKNLTAHAWLMNALSIF